MTSYAFERGRMAAEPTVAASTAARLFALNLSFVLVRAVLPNTIQFVREGRPAPTVPVEVTGAAHVVSSACSLATVVVALLSLGLVVPSVARLRPLVLGWMVYLGVGVAIALHRGGWQLSTTAVVCCALLAALWLEVDVDVAIRVGLRLIAATGVLSLLLAVLAPAAAKYGDVGAGWFTRNARLAGPFSTPNEESNLFAIGVTLWAARWRRRGGGTPKLGTLLQLAVVALPLLLSQSYTAWAATAAGLTVVMLGPRGTRGWRPSKLWLLALLAAVYPARELLRFLDAQQTPAGFSGRRAVWDFVGQHWRDAYLIGHGPGAWRTLVESGAVPAWAVNGHSQVLDTLYTTGLVGLSALIVLVVAMSLRSARLWRHGSVAALGCLVVELVRSYTEVPFQILFGGLNLFVLLLVLGLMSQRRDPQQLVLGVP
jgi:O-antigen ligase